MTLCQLKHMIADEVKRTHWYNVKLLRGKKEIEIPDKYNGRTLRSLNISIGEKLVSVFRCAPLVQPDPLLFMDDETKEETINPKVRKAFEEIFDRFTVNRPGKMTSEDFAVAMQTAIGSDQIKSDNGQIKEVYKTHDVEMKGYLTKEQFVHFYIQSSKQKGGVVMDNLKLLGYNERFERGNISKSSYDERDLASYHIFQKKDMLYVLFDLMDNNDSLGENAWNLFNRLPAVDKVINKILSLEESETGAIIEKNSIYKTLYSMYIVEYLLEDENLIQNSSNNSFLKKYINGDEQTPEYNDNTEELFIKDWRKRFIAANGFSVLFEILKKYINHESSSTLVNAENAQLLMICFLMKSVKKFILAHVTLDSPHIFRDIAFICSQDVPFEILIGKEPTSEDISKLKLTSSNEKTQTDGVIIGPENKPSQTEGAQAGEINEEAEKEAKKLEKEKKYKELVTRAIESFNKKLEETESFILFRENLRNIENMHIEDLNIEETLKFTVGIAEKILNKTETVEFEEVSLVELCLSISF